MSKSRVRGLDNTSETTRHQRSLLDLLPAAVIVTRYDGTLVYANQRVMTEFGFEVGRKIQDFYENPDQRQTMIDTLRQQGYLDNFEMAFRTTVGVPVRVLISSHAFEFEGEAAILSSLVNITARYQAEELIARERANFQKIFAAAPVGLLLLDADLVIMRANPALGKIILRDPAEMLAQRAGGGLNCVYSTEHPRGCGFGEACSSCPLRRGLESVLNNGTQVHGDEIPVDLVISGQPQRRWLRINVEQLEIDSKKHLIVAIDDVTESKKIAEVLKESEMLYQALVEQAGDAFFAHDLNGRFIEVNQRACDSLGYTRTELLQMGVDDIEQDFDLQAAQAEWAKIEPGAPFTLLGHQRRKDGSLFPVEVRFGRFDRHGEKFFLGLVRDITERQQAESSLHASETRYRQAITAAGAVPYYRDYQNQPERYSFIGEGILNLTGYSAAEITPALFDQLEQESVMRDELAHLTQTEAGQLSKAGQIQHWACDYRLRTRDGRTRWVADSAVQVRDANNRRIGVIGILQDITERKRAEAHLALQAERMGILHKMERAITSSLDLERILDLLTDEIVKQLRVDACALLLLNPQTNRLEFAAKKGFLTTALDATNLTIGTGLAGQAAQERKIVHNVNLPQSADDNPALAKSIQDESFVSYFGVPLIVKEQLLGVLEIFHRTELAPEPDWLEFLETLADQAAISIDNARLLEITQQSLKETNALYSINQYLIATTDPELLMTNVVDLLQKNFGYYYVQIFIADPFTGNFIMRAGSGEIGQKLKAQGYFLSAGDGIVGFTAETGNPFFTNNVDNVISFVRTPFLPDTKSELAVPIKVNTQFLGLLDVHQSPLSLLTERDVQLVSAVADQLAVAMQKARIYADLQEALQHEHATRAQLIQAEKLTISGRLLASVSHELNNPIQAIQNALFLLREEHGISLQGKLDLEIVLSETDRMATLLERLRATYQPANQDEFQPVQINTLIEDTCALVATHLRHSRVSYAFQADPDLPPVQGLSNQLRQVVLNLVMNAVDAMSAGGHLMITTQFLPAGNEILVKIADTGTGIDAAILPHIFEAFVTSKAQGTGLGLAISYEIILKHRGRILAENNPERGATFSVWLPVAYQGFL
jgi:PAS domain S-box-containing protein